LLPHRHTRFAEKLEMLWRRMTPVKGGDGHFFFGADADLRVIIEAGDEIDIKGCVCAGADLADDAP
jgi:hypothetical protein